MEVLQTDPKTGLWVAQAVSDQQKPQVLSWAYKWSWELKGFPPWATTDQLQKALH